MISRKCSGSFLSLVTLVPRVMMAAASCQCVAGQQELLRAGLLWKTSVVTGVIMTGIFSCR